MNMDKWEEDFGFLVFTYHLLQGTLTNWWNEDELLELEEFNDKNYIVWDLVWQNWMKNPDTKNASTFTYPEPHNKNLIAYTNEFEGC